MRPGESDINYPALKNGARFFYFKFPSASNRSSPGEWEPVLTRDHLVRTNDVMGDPGGLAAFEERTAREAGYRRADLAIVDSPSFA